MNFIHLALPSSAQKPRLLLLALLIAMVDIAVFIVLNQSVSSISSAHLCSFAFAASVGYIAHKIWPINSVNKPFLFSILALLVVLLRGGLLASRSEERRVGKECA